MIQQESPLPIRKVSVAALSGAVLTIAFFVYSAVTKRTVDPGVAAAIATIVAFASSYFVPPAIADSHVTIAPPSVPKGP